MRPASKGSVAEKGQARENNLNLDLERDIKHYT